MKKYVLFLILLFILIPTKTYAITIDSNISGDAFFQVINETSDDEDINILIHNYSHKSQELEQLADRIEASSQIKFDYDAACYEVKTTVKNMQTKLQYTTDAVKEMETAKTVIDVANSKGDDFFKVLNNCKNNCKILLKANQMQDLMRFQKEVKKKSKYLLNYEIITEDTIKSLENGCYLEIEDKTKDIKACEKMISKIKGWNKMTDSKKFLTLAKKCNKKSMYYKPKRDEFHFYNKINYMVCRDYARGFIRIACMITENCKTEYVVNKLGTHALAVINIGNNYWECNNYYISKNYKCKLYSLREFYKEDLNRNWSPLVLKFLSVNGY